ANRVRSAPRRVVRTGSASSDSASLRACLICRAGFAGRGTAGARVRALAIYSRPATKSWLGLYAEALGGRPIALPLLVPVEPEVVERVRVLPVLVLGVLGEEPPHAVFGCGGEGQVVVGVEPAHRAERIAHEVGVADVVELLRARMPRVPV